MDEGLATLDWAVRIGEQLFEMDADDYIDRPKVPWTFETEEIAEMIAISNPYPLTPRLAMPQVGDCWAHLMPVGDTGRGFAWL